MELISSWTCTEVAFGSLFDFKIFIRKFGALRQNLIKNPWHILELYKGSVKSPKLCERLISCKPFESLLFSNFQLLLLINTRKCFQTLDAAGSHTPFEKTSKYVIKHVTICYKTPLNYSKCKNDSNFSISPYWDNNHFISSLWLLLDTTYMHSIPLSPVHISLYRFPFFILVPWVLKY